MLKLAEYEAVVVVFVDVDKLLVAVTAARHVTQLAVGVREKDGKRGNEVLYKQPPQHDRHRALTHRHTA